MRKEKKEKLMALYEYFCGDIVATEEQIKFLLQEYKDKDTIVGIHNTSGIDNLELFFKNGLYNNTFLNEQTRDLTNTVFYSDVLAGLMTYPNGDGTYREGAAIILKIPKAVFKHEQGIFETLANGGYGIPPQFIRAAFVDGKVIENELSYDKDYQSETAEMCENELTFGNKKEHIKIFKKVYYHKENRWETLKRKLHLRKKETKLLESKSKDEGYQEEVTSTLSHLTEKVPTLEEQSAFVKNYQEKNEVGQQVEQKIEDKAKGFEQND